MQYRHAQSMPPSHGMSRGQGSQPVASSSRVPTVRARCVATLLHEMKRRGRDCRFGVVSMCIVREWEQLLFLREATQVMIYPMLNRSSNPPSVKPVFKKDGSTTAGTSSQVIDGAGAVLLMKRSLALQKGLPILGVFRTFAALVFPLRLWVLALLLPSQLPSRLLVLK
nr:3-ketoacyl-CoA thiolase 2, peroxisomal [Tanacetum cinerariifolium]